jgi:hypothetical protein
MGKDYKWLCARLSLMTDPTMQQLIDRLGKLSGPDRETDARIWAEVDGRDVVGPVNSGNWANTYFGKSRSRPHDECFLFQPAEPNRASQAAEHIRRYTGSIDAALTLVPDGEPWTLTGSKRGAYSSEVGEDWQYAGANPAIALCIAALKSRQSSRAAEKPGGEQG